METSVPNDAKEALPSGAVAFTVVRDDDSSINRFVLGPRSSELDAARGTVREVVRIGRGHETDVKVDILGVSTIHAELRWRSPPAGRTSGGIIVRDVSVNGTGMRAPNGSKSVLKKGVDTVAPHGSQLLLPMRAQKASGGDKPKGRRTLLTLKLDDEQTGHEASDSSSSSSRSVSPITPPEGRASSNNQTSTSLELTKTSTRPQPSVNGRGIENLAEACDTLIHHEKSQELPSLTVPSQPQVNLNGASPAADIAKVMQPVAPPLPLQQATLLEPKPPNTEMLEAAPVAEPPKQGHDDSLRDQLVAEVIDAMQQPGSPPHKPPDSPTYDQRVDAEDFFFDTRVEKLARQATHTFQPGRLGLKVGPDTGIVEEVFADGQAHTQGIKMGYQLLKIGDEPFTGDALVRAVKGDRDYHVTFQVSKEEEKPPRGRRRESSKKRKHGRNRSRSRDRRRSHSRSKSRRGSRRSRSDDRRRRSRSRQSYSDDRRKRRHGRSRSADGRDTRKREENATGGKSAGDSFPSLPPPPSGPPPASAHWLPRFPSGAPFPPPPLGVPQDLPGRPAMHTPMPFMLAPMTAPAGVQTLAPQLAQPAPTAASEWQDILADV